MVRILSTERVKLTHHHRRRADSYQERGKALKCSRVDPTLGLPYGQGKANKIWPKDDWDRVLSSWETGGVERVIENLIAFIKTERCTFEISFLKFHSKAMVRVYVVL